jgi:arginine deiminase
MNKKNNIIKKLLFTCIVTFTLPNMVFAANDLFIQSCLKADGTGCTKEGGNYQVEAGETVTITMSVETEKKINGFSATVELENMSNFTDFTYANIWGNDSAVNQNTFLVMRDPSSIPASEDLTKQIGSFKVTAGSTLGKAKITFQDIDATYLEGTSVEDYTPSFTGSLTFNIIESKSNDNTNTKTNQTNENTNTKENINNDKKTSETTDNPKTGIYGGSILLIAIAIGGYFAMKKKNLFKKI